MFAAFAVHALGLNTHFHSAGAFDQLGHVRIAVCDTATQKDPIPWWAVPVVRSALQDRSARKTRSLRERRPRVPESPIRDWPSCPNPRLSECREGACVPAGSTAAHSDGRDRELLALRVHVKP